MPHDRSTVEKVIQLYFDGLYEGDADKIGEAFHPSADLRWVEKGELQVLRCRTGWSACASGRRRRRKASRATISSSAMDRSDDATAFVKVKCQLPPRYFTDYLVALKLADGWKIVSKSYRYDVRE